MQPSYVPLPPAIFIGREVEISRIEEMFTRVKVAVIYGVGGMGKSALAYAVAARWRAGIVHHSVVPDEPIAAQIDDVRRRLAGGPVPEITSDHERTLSLAEKLDESETLFLLDDVHRLDTPSRTLLMETLSRVLRRGRVIATSRELVSAAAADADRFELRLQGLDLASARALWSSLDELYGSSNAFEHAWIRSHGNPFLLRRAHAGGLGDEDPVTSTIRGLSPDEHLLAGILGIAEIQLPTSLVLSALPAERARLALQQLVTRMIVIVHEPEGCALHDLFRGPVCESLTSEERNALHLALATRLAETTLDPVVRVREVTRHLRAIDKFSEAGAYLLKHSRELVRNGATGELLRGLDAIPLEHRSLDVKVCHARTLGRLLDLPRAHLELKELSEKSPQAKVDLKVALGNIAMLTANLPEAERVLREVLEHDDLAPRLRTRAEAIFALTLTSQGRGTEARALLTEADQRSSDPLDRGYLSICRGFSLWLDGQVTEAEEPVLRSQVFFEKEPSSYRAANYATFFLTALWANLGKLSQAKQGLERSELSLKGSEDLRMRAVVTLVRAIYCFEAGQRSTALDELRRVYQTFDRAGEGLNRLWTQCWIARILLVLGRRREGLQALEGAEQDIRRCGILPFLKLVQQARQDDPLVLARQREPTHFKSPKQSEAIRGRALAALRAAGSGDSAAVDAFLETIAAEVETSDYALDRAIGLLARAVLAQLSGDEREAAHFFNAAVRSAKEGGADVDLIPKLLRNLGSLRVVTPHQRCVTSEPWRPTPNQILIDKRSHRIHFRRSALSLARRPVLRRLLYTLALRPNASVSKERLAQAIWDCDYHPLQHDNPLKVNVRELRRLLDRTELSVTFDGEGYKLLVPVGFVFLDQFDWISKTGRSELPGVSQLGSGFPQP